MGKLRITIEVEGHEEAPHFFKRFEPVILEAEIITQQFLLSAQEIIVDHLRQVADFEKVR